MHPTLRSTAGALLMASGLLAMPLSTMPLAAPAGVRISKPAGVPPVEPKPGHLRAIMPRNRPGVVRPPGGVDPGILRPTPAMPSRSTPVIHPDRVRSGKPAAGRILPQ